jgi:general secretion pathway protein D
MNHFTKGQIMKMQQFKKYVGGILVFLFCIAIEVHAQQRPGGGGGGGGGFGGFGGFGGGGANRNTAANSSTSSSQYNNNGSVGSATFSVDPDTHNIVVIADDQTAQQIQDVISHLDTPMRQVLIKVVFIEVDHNNSSDIGIEGQYTGLNKNFSAITGYMTNFSVVGAGTPQAAIVPQSITPIQQSVALQNNFGLASAGSPQGLYQILGSDFQATLRAIAQAGKAQILSRPSILARDGQLAQIVVGQSIFLPSGVAFSAVGNSGATIPTINGSYQNVGIQLNVTPFIGANNMVQMILQPETTSVDTSTPGQVIAGGSLFSSAVYAPNINTRSANTVVVTPDAQTIVIGGLIANTKASNDSKVPFLGDIPILGNLFKASSKSSTKQELLIFVTPHIVQAPGQLAVLSNHEFNQTQLITNSVSEKELDQFLDRLPVKKKQ